MAQAVHRRSAASARARSPLESLFRLLTSVRFAIGIITFLVISALVGVILPQVPDFVRGDPSAKAQWLSVQAGRYGPFTDAMDRADLFDVFHSAWFTVGLGVLLVSIAVCTASRFPPIWRSIRRPQRRVNDRYFEIAHHRASFTTPQDAGALSRVLRKKRYRVETSTRDGATYLYADRFSWAQLGTFASHLALLIFLAGGLVTWRMGFKQEMLMAPGATEPLMGVASSDHMQVKVLDFKDPKDAQGRDLTFQTDLAVYKDGKQVAQGSSTVNNPFHYDGFVFHQTTLDDDGAALTVRDAATGRALYDDVVRLSGRLPAPRVSVRDPGGRVVYDDFVAPTTFIGENVSSAQLALADGSSFWIATTTLPQSPAPGQPPFKLAVVDHSGAGRTIAYGAHDALDGYTFTFSSMGAAKYLAVDDLAGGGRTLIETLAGANAAQHMTLVFPNAAPVQLDANTSLVAGGRTYEFGGPRTLTGITVKKDPGSKFIWIATALMLIGLSMTFYLPRRRLWAKITPERTWLAGIADRASKFSREMQAIGAEAGSPDALQPDPPRAARPSRTVRTENSVPRTKPKPQMTETVTKRG